MRLIRSVVFYILVLELAATAGLAQAGYEVVTNASSSVAITGNTIQYAYNWSPLGTGFQMLSGSCTVPRASCIGSGTGDTVGNLMYSSDQTAAFGTDPDNVNLGASASAAAFASLAAGAVGVSSTGTYLDFNGSGGLTGGTARAYAQIVDGLTVYAPGASVNNPVDIGVTFTIDGVFDVSAPYGNSFANVDSFFDVGTAAYNDTIYDGGQTSWTPTLQATPGVSGWASYSFAVRTPGQIVFNGFYAITTSVESVGISAALDDYCGAGIGCDYYHTGAISLSLPQGVSYTSDSGVFLSQPSGAPEPASAGLAAAAVAALTFMRSRARRRSRALSTGSARCAS